jgi:uncharacterized membrane protein YphA (DoxX/SURF4 family)
VPATTDGEAIMRRVTDHEVYVPLRLTYGLVPILAGLDKFTNLLADWERYLHPAIAELLPVSAGAFMHAVGIVEIAAGALVLSRFTRAGAYIVMAWLAAIAVQLLGLGLFDVAVRDLAMAVGAYTLARLAQAREQQGVLAPAPSGGTLERAEAR